MSYQITEYAFCKMSSLEQIPNSEVAVNLLPFSERSFEFSHMQEFKNLI